MWAATETICASLSHRFLSARRPLRPAAVTMFGDNLDRQLPMPFGSEALRPPRPLSPKLWSPMSHQCLSAARPFGPLALVAFDIWLLTSPMPFGSEALRPPRPLSPKLWSPMSHQCLSAARPFGPNTLLGELLDKYPVTNAFRQRGPSARILPIGASKFYDCSHQCLSAARPFGPQELNELHDALHEQSPMPFGSEALRPRVERVNEGKFKETVTNAFRQRGPSALALLRELER